MTLGSLFSGIGGFEYAAVKNGITPLWASEIEAAPISITKRHFPEMKHLGDVTKINGAKINPVDIITFGSPCQDLSVAGKRKGLSGERSGLFTEAVRIIRQMRSKTNGKYPAKIIWENVKGVFSSNKGEDFRTVIEEIARIADAKISIPHPRLPSGTGWPTSGAVMGEGWSLAWRVMDSQYWGIPQRRKRIFLVADFTGERAGKILFEPDGLPGNPAEGGKAREGTAAGVTEGAGTAIAVDGYNRTVSDTVQCLRHGRADGDHQGIVLQPVPTRASAVWPEKTGSLIARADGSPRVDRDQPFIYDARRNPPATFEAQGFGYYKQSGTAGTLKSGESKDTAELISENYTLRRLTPTECERLQGFPEGWTEYGIEPEKYGNSPEKGKKRAGPPESVPLMKISDSRRYKALGNSVAIPCVEFILRRIKETANFIPEDERK